MQSMKNIKVMNQREVQGRDHAIDLGRERSTRRRKSIQRMEEDIERKINQETEVAVVTQIIDEEIKIKGDDFLNKFFKYYLFPFVLIIIIVTCTL